MNLSRRGLIGGLVALVAAPAIVRVESLMVLPAPQKIISSGEILVGDIVALADGGAITEQFVVTKINNNFLTLNKITREAVKLWKNSNEFIQHIDRQYELQLRIPLMGRA